MLSRRLFAVCGLAVAGGFSFAAPAAAEKWDMPLAYPASNYHSETAAKFAELVKQKTGGKIEIVTHPNGSLFKGDEIFRAVRTGQAPIGERLMSAIGNEGPIFEIDSVPFLATSFAASKKLHKAAAAETDKVMASKGVKLLYAVAWPPQGLYSKKPIASGADMKGVKFRAYSPATAKIAEMLGAVATKIEAAEVTQAFSTGVVESMISSGSTGYDAKLWESTKYWYDVQAWLPKNMVFINLDVWNKLDEPTKKAVTEAAAEAEAIGWAKAEELSGYYKKELAAKGMSIEAPTAQLKADFEKVGAQMVQEWSAKAGDGGKAAIEAFKKM
ncbi:MAG: TRAP transporter substrate-binding protein [Rhizobiales bacterium]|nr:TRAP transporter substrate-binding protein [Hyphomicrobiales bacterium]